MTEASHEQEFQNRMLVRTPVQVRIERWALLFIVLAPLAMIVFVLLPLRPEDVGWMELLRAALARQPLDGALLLALLPAALLSPVYLALARRRERLFVSSQGIRYQSPLPPVLRFLRPDWQLRWGEVREAEFAGAGAWLTPMAPTLVLRGAHGFRRLRPYAWVDDAELQRLMALSVREAIAQARQLRSADIVAAIDGCALMRQVRAYLPHLAIGSVGAVLPAPFAIEKNRRALIASVAFFALLGYAIADFVVNRERYAEHAPIGVFAVAGVSLALLALEWMRRGAVPAAERTVIAVLLGGALSAALYPGLLRLNQATDAHGLQDYRYRLQSQAVLAPERAGPPALAFPQFWDYWAQFPQGSVHEFRLRRGGLGFWQMDMAPFHAKTREFYARQP